MPFTAISIEVEYDNGQGFSDVSGTFIPFQAFNLKRISYQPDYSLILFYISGHGLGHMSREGEVIKQLRRLRPDVQIGVKTPAAEFFVRENLHGEAIYERLKIDIGVEQSDSLDVDPASTLQNYSRLIDNKRKIIDAEARWCKENSVQIIVADIPPVAFDIAEQAGLKSICITNFSWDWIYQPYVETHPEYSYVIDDIKASESKCSLLLYTPFSGDLTAFPRRKSIPLIGRKSELQPEEIRRRLNIPGNKKVVLFSFGGFGLNRVEELKPDIDSDTIVVTSRIDTAAEGWTHYTDEELTANGLSYRDLVNMSDAVLTKPGYGIVSECVANNTGMLYVPRKLFPEYKVFERGMANYIPAVKIPLDDFYAGKWNDYLLKIYEWKQELELLPVNGAEIAAEIILKEME